MRGGGLYTIIGVLVVIILIIVILRMV